ncbi:hypothetical protein HPB52_002697 [Rhipicephalus sanguineus]|uniref:Uncharacterized protein n=1 Tax=Rhipicephalus sanguineus TaxID=34632 RepID=A0A9D4SRB2_RHISA|nr:hypothetical protein HPB52_002697 [Rhipicephalus sanguineus]
MVAQAHHREGSCLTKIKKKKKGQREEPPNERAAPKSAFGLLQGVSCQCPAPQEDRRVVVLPYAVVRQLSRDECQAALAAAPAAPAAAVPSAPAAMLHVPPQMLLSLKAAPATEAL